MRKLAGLQIKFAYKKGSENKVAYALSRVGFHFPLNATSVGLPVWIQELVNSYHNDPKPLHYCKSWHCHLQILRAIL
jgi:hypothetical protein